jgi:hypothetical protein
MIKYVIHPGHVISKNDGERHYISAAQLMYFYKVRPGECVVDHYDNYIPFEGRELIHLYPKYNGDYELD